MPDTTAPASDPAANTTRLRARAFFAQADDDDYLLVADAIAKFGVSESVARRALTLLVHDRQLEAFRIGRGKILAYRRGAALKGARP